MKYFVNTVVELSVVNIGFFDDLHKTSNTGYFAIAVVKKGLLIHSHHTHEVSRLCGLSIKLNKLNTMMRIQCGSIYVIMVD